MSGTTQSQVLEIIWDWGGEASINIIAKELHISTDYARLICEDLDRNDYINFLHSKLCVLKGRGKLEAAKMIAGRNPKKTAVLKKGFKFGFGKDKKGRLIINY